MYSHVFTYIHIFTEFRIISHIFIFALSQCGYPPGPLSDFGRLPCLPPIPSKRSKWGEWGELGISLNFPRGHPQCPLISEIAPSTLQISKTPCCFISQNFHGGQQQPPLSSRCRSAAHQKKYWPILFDPQFSGTQPPCWCVNVGKMPSGTMCVVQAAMFEYKPVTPGLATCGF